MIGFYALTDFECMIISERFPEGQDWGFKRGDFLAGKIEQNPLNVVDIISPSQRICGVPSHLIISWEDANKLKTIASKVLGFPSFESRRIDRLDFRSVCVTAVKEALELSYMEGRTQGRHEASELQKAKPKPKPPRLAPNRKKS